MSISLLHACLRQFQFTLNLVSCNYLPHLTVIITADMAVFCWDLISNLHSALPLAGVYFRGGHCQSEVRPDCEG